MSKLIIFSAIKNQKSGSDSANSHLIFDFSNILWSIFQISFFLFSLLCLSKNKVLNLLELLMLWAKLIIGATKDSIDFQKEDVYFLLVALLSSRFEANFK